MTEVTQVAGDEDVKGAVEGFHYFEQQGSSRRVKAAEDFLNDDL